LIDGYAKPAIFLLLGALVDPATLLHYAPIGLLISLIFIFVLRPLVVFVSLGLFTLVGKERISWQELSFISWVRETGAIPAVLLVTVVSRGIPGTEALLPIGLWVILSTLILQPPLTPWWARVLGLVEKETEAALPVEAQQA
jgi:cell volume regulation protein A